MFDFLGLKLAVLTFVVVLGLWLYGKYISGKTLPTSADLFANVKVEVEKLEAAIAAKAVEAEAKGAEIVTAQTTKEAIDADVAKLKAFVEKVKSIL